MNKIGHIIKELRMEMDCTQNKLADVLGVTQDSISLWENDKRVPDTQYIVGMAKFFDVSTDYLLGLTNEYKSIKTAEYTNRDFLTPEENVILIRFRNMSESQRKLLKQYMDLLK